MLNRSLIVVYLFFLLAARSLSNH